MKELVFNNPNINYWFTSDYHYWHANIVSGVSKWTNKDECRDFRDQKQMSDHIVDMTNKYVKEDDVLFFNGDWCFSGIQNIWNFRKRLNCKTIYLCTGNHDHHLKANKVLPNVFHDVEHAALFDSVSTPKYVEEESETTIRVHAQELFRGVEPLYEIKVHGQRITLCHYAMLTWYFHNKGSWMLFGHSHDKLEVSGKSMDVGIDSAKRILGEYRPFKFQELQKIMASKEYVQIDGHSTKTNAQ